MAEITNEEINELFNRIKERTDIDISKDTIRTWSREDVDKLLKATEKDENSGSHYFSEEDSIYTSPDSYTGGASDITDAVQDKESSDETAGEVYDETSDEGFSDAEEDPCEGEDEYAPAKAEDSGSESIKKSRIPSGSNLKEAADKAGVVCKDSFSKIKKRIFRFREAEESDEKRYELYPDPKAPSETDDEDVKIADFSQKGDKNITDSDDKTRYFSAVSSNNRAADASPVKEEAAADDNGQYIIKGWNGDGETVSTVDSETAETELNESREELAREFTIDEPDQVFDNSDTVDSLMSGNDTQKAISKQHFKSYNGPRYTSSGDIRRIKRNLRENLKNSKKSIIALSCVFVLAVLTSVFAAKDTTVGGDKMGTILWSLITICLALLISWKNIFYDIIHIKDHGLTVKSMSGITAIVCFLQTLLMFFIYIFNANNISVFGCSGVALLLLTEISDYLMVKRMSDAFSLCLGSNTNKLYSIDSVTDDKDIATVMNAVHSGKSRIRYSPKIEFPSYLLELCSSESLPDKKSGLLSVIILFSAVISLIVSWVVTGNFVIAIGAFTSCLCLSVPAYAVILIQLPLRQINKSLNKAGSLISCQESVSRLSDTNVIMFNASELFNPQTSRVIEVKDFGKMRAHDARLYAAAMAIHADGPLSCAFEKLVDDIHELPVIKEFSYDQKMGVTGLIRGQRVCFGNKALMDAHSVSVPVDADEDFYLSQGYNSFYLAVDGQLVCMPIVEYSADQKLFSTLKGLDTEGICILVSSSDPNVTAELIKNKFNYEFSNCYVADSTAKRVVNNYCSRRTGAAKAFSVHDGTANSMLKTIYGCITLNRLFKAADIITFVVTAMGCILSILISFLGVIEDTPTLAVIVIQCILFLSPIGIVSFLYKK